MRIDECQCRLHGMGARLVPVMGERGCHGVWTVAHALRNSLNFRPAGFRNGRVAFQCE